MDYWIGMITFCLVLGYYGVKNLYRSVRDNVEE
ncbi:hypothetical protein F938_02047 [Acinetobacter bereziniae LMG 1003 = CIP 70.12]|uniref:Uncharacterized protein n=1 Tax=Acinetobacter bereziniae LMG 1003 = CIP 70.12 TaxID=981324 RepID=N9EVD0_ACIBZ|nr:hypothetical protein F938_02047 [Acinetobacter bereziniae LMG 1003 = CIP 70.12]